MAEEKNAETEKKDANLETVEIEGVGKGTWNPQSNKLQFSNDTLRKFAADNGVDGYKDAMQKLSHVHAVATEKVVPFLGQKVAATHEKAVAAFGTGEGSFKIDVDGERNRRNPRDPSQVIVTYGEISLSVYASKPDLGTLQEQVAADIAKSYKH